MTVTTVAILGGTGPQGRGIGLRLARAGIHVTIGSRDGARAVEVAKEMVATAGGGHPLAIDGAANAAASSAEVVFIAVPWDAHQPTLVALRAELEGRLVVDVVNPLRFDEHGPIGIAVAEGSAAQQAQALLPGSTVVSGFHHVSAKTLLDESHSVDEDIMICGDDPGAKRTVMDLAELLPGARAIDAGPLRLSGLLEGMTAVLLAINKRYRTTTGIHLTDLDPSRVRPY
ncbi:MAG: NADPH-dependent F420 reductase [Acidimicrobiales bacterium]